MYPKQSFFIVLFIVFSCSLVFENCSPKPKSVVIKSDSTALVGSNTCKSCHSKEYNDWKISDHFKAMDTANDSSVLGILYVQTNQRNKAMAPITILKTNYPNNPDFQQ